ncbi:MAG: hypothetical protein IH865_02815 [Chloroflexi bacterium]|nr:hypothetical protein [Chloroflexota bacterium]
MDADTRTQFELISEITDLFRRARIRFWLRGGWALDFLIGRVTRTHSDIDLVTWRRHAGRIQRMLLTSGYEVAAVTDQAAIHFAKNGQDIAFAFIKRKKQGRIVTPGREFWPWPPFPDTVRTLKGIACRTMSVAALLEEKENYEKHSGRPLRSKDKASIRALRSLR